MRKFIGYEDMRRQTLKRVWQEDPNASNQKILQELKKAEADWRQSILEMIAEFWDENMDMTADINISKEDVIRFHDFVNGKLDLLPLTHEQRIKLGRTYIMGEYFFLDKEKENPFKMNPIRYENADYCDFCNHSSLQNMDKVTDRKGTIVFCACCRVSLGVENLLGLEGDDELKCMVTNKCGAVKFVTNLLPKPLIVLPEILIRMFDRRTHLTDAEQEKIDEIYGGRENTSLFFHCL